MRKTCSVLLATVFLAFSTTGCDSSRLQNFATFAGLGTTYVSAFHGLTKAAGDAYIANSNATMIALRDPKYVSPKLLPGLEENARLTRDYLISLQKLDAQADLLGSYFAAIAQLTGTKSAEAVSASMQSLVDALKGVAPGVENATIGGQPIVSYAPQASTIVVARFEVKALDRRLEDDAPVIDHALVLQEAAVNAISLQLSLALKDSNEMFETSHIARPYLLPGPLPPSWAADREKVIRTTVITDGASGAKEAIKSLRKNFEELVSNKDAPLDLKSLLDSLQKMIAYVNAATTATTTATTK